MSYLPHILITDALIYFLLVLVVGFAVYASRHEHLRAPWRQVFNRPLAVAALMVLSVYISIGLADSVHLRERISDTGADRADMEAQYSHQVISLLDIFLGSLRQHSEKTYSMPFATHAFSMETVIGQDGSVRREHPRLLYGGAHLKDISKRGQDIAVKTVTGILVGLIAWLLFAVLIIKVVAVRTHMAAGALWLRIKRGDTRFPWRSALSTGAVISAIVSALIVLSGNYHVLGTDQVGNDVLYKSLKSIRTGLLIGTLTTLVMLPFAVSLGIMAGYLRGWVDDVIQYTYTTLSSIPGVLLIAAAILSLQVYMTANPEQFTTVAERSDMRLLFLCIILGVTSWTGLCRLMRGETLKLREVDYIQAAVALGVPTRKIMLRHIFPNVMHIVLISVVLDFSGLVLAEAVLSYVGVGVDPAMDSWGNMINGARLEMAREPMVWWSLSAAFVFMFGLVLSANLFSDAVRDAFDPRLRKR